VKLEGGRYSVNRLVYLVMAALVATMILVPSAFGAQQTKQGTTETKTETTAESKQPLPKSGGPGIGSLLLPTAALLAGSGVLVYVVVARRR
jgi:hypothetical protein